MYAKYEKIVFHGGALVQGNEYRMLRNRPHWHKEFEFIVCHKGVILISLDSTEYQLGPGTCAFVPGGMIHSINSEGNSLVAVAQFDRNLIATVTDSYFLKSPIFKDSYDAFAVIQEIRDETCKGQQFYGHIVNALFSALMFRIFQREPLVKRGETPHRNVIASYKKLLVKIRENPAFSFENAAALMNMTPSYFSRYFKKITGMTYTTYINQVKIEKAIDLMGRNPQITSRNLMVQAGFGTLRNFNRVFRRITGFSPGNLPESYVFSARVKLEEDVGSVNPTLEESECIMSTDSDSCIK